MDAPRWGSPLGFEIYRSKVASIKARQPRICADPEQAILCLNDRVDHVVREAIFNGEVSPEIIGGVN